jgi:hypothetical protein
MGDEDRREEFGPIEARLASLRLAPEERAYAMRQVRLGDALASFLLAVKLRLWPGAAKVIASGERCA